MKVLLNILLLLFFGIVRGQDTIIDSLKKELANAKDDTSRVILMDNLAELYCFRQIDSANEYTRKALKLSNESNYPYGQFATYVSVYYGYLTIGDYSKTLEIALNALRMADQLPNRRLESLARAHMILGYVYRLTGNYTEAIAQQNLAIQLQTASGQSQISLIIGEASTAMSYLGVKKPDSALWVVGSIINLAQSITGIKNPDSAMWYMWDYLAPDAQRSWPVTYAVIGLVHESLGNKQLARKYYIEGISTYNYHPNPDNQYFLMRLYINYSRFFLNEGEKDSSLYYSSLAFHISHQNNFPHYELDAAKLIVHLYESQKKPDSVVKYLSLMMAVNDSMFSQSRIRKFQAVEYTEEQRKKEMEVTQEKYRDRLRFYVLLGALAVFLLLALILFRNNRQKQKANSQLEKQRRATEIQKAKVELALTELKLTQAQLIQSEKMASLGELTAGIAHEIQNPLNFVNNFSELNKELLDEMENELHAGNNEEAISIVKDIKENEEKINQHGKRADAIVKGMLQHSRVSTGQKESTDINALTDEYLKLSYLGLRAKDQTFNATLQTDFDESIENLNIIPQDIGRVFINLYNNAFYAVTEKKKQVGGSYEPTVSLSTKRINGKVEIRVADNGNGIPQKVLDKIFQPFFTTKPTGQGTGLGLSLAYDIIKAHGGEIKVDTTEGEFAVFVIQLPIAVYM
jgi:two-component system, NtrC family, sensor kinase